MIYIIMGVSGSGKSSLGIFLSEKLGWTFHEGDNFHPWENVEKMANGRADDVCYLKRPPNEHVAFCLRQEYEIGGREDRLPWLLKLHDVIERERRSGSDAFMACSALKRQYRQILLYGSTALTSSAQDVLPQTPPDVFFLYLHGDYDLIYQRMASRKGHYMKADLLRSQFDVLEPPSDEENVLSLDIRRGITDMAGEVQKHIISQKPLCLVMF